MNLKYLTCISVLILGLCMCACTGKKADKAQDEPLDSIIRCELPDTVVEQLDTLCSIVCQIIENEDIKKIIASGTVNISDIEKQSRPDYLITKEDVNDLLTINQKYAAMAQMVIDRKLTEIYRMDEEDDYYRNEMERLGAEVGLTTDNSSVDTYSVTDISDFYNKVKREDRLDIFYSASAAYLVEALYIISRNPAAFMPGVTDDMAQRISRGVSIVANGSQTMAEANPELEPVAEALLPLATMNATTAVALQNQIESLSAEMEAARKAMLK